MHFLKCNHCGHLNEVKIETLIFCSQCNKKIDNNFPNWRISNPEKTFDDFKQLICISEDEVKKSSMKAKSRMPKGLKYWIPVVIVFAIFYAIGQWGGEKIKQVFIKPILNQAMVEYADELNKTCPFTVDEATQLDNVIVLPDNVFQYNYTLAFMKDSVNTDELKNYLEPRILNNIKTQPEMKIIRDNQVTLNYNYRDRTGAHLLTISVKPEQYK